MKIFARTAVLVLGITVGSIAVRADEGTDAGTLVVSVGETNANYISYAIFLRKVHGKDQQRVWYAPGNIFYRRKADFVGEDNGIVDVRKLAPGDYEIFNFQIYTNNGISADTWSSRSDFSLPFHIDSGKATYIGNFTAHSLSGKNIFGMTIPAGGYFVVSDKAERDIPLASKDNPDLPQPVVSAIADAKAANSPFIRPAPAN